MNATKSALIANGIVPRAPRIPADIDALLSSAVLGWCPVQSVAKRVQADHLAVLISETLVEAGL
jgi:hypothetical protein